MVQVRLAHDFRGLETKKLKHIAVANARRVGSRVGAFPYGFGKPLLVLGKTEAAKSGVGDLPLELAHLLGAAQSDVAHPQSACVPAPLGRKRGHP